MSEPDKPLIWAHGIAWCNACCHEWIAVWPLGADDLECPKCYSMDTERESEDARDADD